MIFKMSLSLFLHLQLKKGFAEEIKEAKLFTIMADGTTDENRKELQGLVCRYWTPNGNLKEHCLNIKV